jgi:hypothetical protein
MNTVYELTKFKIPRVKTTEFGVMIMCRCPHCNAPVKVGKRGTIKCDLCGQLFIPEAAK